MLSRKRRALRAEPRWLLWLCPFVLLAPVWLAGQALYWGTPSTQFVPWWWQAWLTLRAGEWPLWNPLVGMGAPLIANYQSAIFYPPNWLYFVLVAIGGLPLMAWGQAILVAGHLGLAGWGMAKLLHRLGLGELGQIVGGLAFGLSGYLVARSHFLSINSAVAWLPWVLLAVYDLAEAKAARPAVLRLAWCLAMQWLAGHAQLSAYTLLLALAWAALWSRSRLQTAGRLLAAAGLAFAMSAVQLLPTAEYLLQSSRAGQVEPALAMTYSFWPWRLLTLLAPNLFGSPATGNFAGYGNYWEDAIYIGLLPLALAVVAILRAVRRHSLRSNLTVLSRFLLGVAVVALVLALGANTPVFPWLFAHVPGFALFQGPSRYMIWAVLALSMLAATGAQSWREPTGRGLYWSRLALAAGAAIALGGMAAGALRAAGRLELPASFGGAAVWLGFTALAAAALNLWVWRLPAARRTWLIGLVVAADLLAAGWGLNPGTGLGLYSQRFERGVLQAQLGQGRLYIPLQDETELKFDKLFRFDTFFSAQPEQIRESLLPNTNLLEQIASANNFDPLLSARYKLWVDELERAPEPLRTNMLAVMNVSTVEGIAEPMQTDFETIPTLPRVRVVACVRLAANPQDAIRQMGEIDPTGEVIIEAPGEPAGCSGSPGEARIIQASPNSLTVSVSGSGWLLLADTWYPGWYADANGVELPIYPAYGVVRAVQLPAGADQVEFVYRPLAFTIGLWLTLLAWPAWVLGRVRR